MSEGRLCRQRKSALLSFLFFISNSPEWIETPHSLLALKTTETKPNPHT